MFLAQESAGILSQFLLDAHETQIYREKENKNIAHMRHSCFAFRIGQFVVDQICLGMQHPKALLVFLLAHLSRGKTAAICQIKKFQAQKSNFTGTVFLQHKI